MEGKEFTVTPKYIQEATDRSSTSLVGKICKRFELMQSRLDSPPTQELLKKEIKELIYESHRELRDNILAFGMGYEVSQIKFISKEK